MTDQTQINGNGKQALIRTVGLRKLYTTEEVETMALQNVNVEIAAGEFVAIMGPSGCGKSTLLNLLGLLDNPSAGEYWINGEEVASYTERKQAVHAILDHMQITHREKHFPQQLSGGQQQRVAVARAVVAKPKLILADEPTGNLDSTHGDEVMGILTDLNEKGTTIVMVTHSPAYADFAHRIIHLFDGRVVTESIMQERGI